jgi:hypothetical protein
MPGFMPGIRVFGFSQGKTWMAGSFLRTRRRFAPFARP